MPHLTSHTIFSQLSKVRALCLALLLLFGLGSTSFLAAQITADRAQLEKEKIAIQKRLREFDTVLRKTTDEKKFPSNNYAQ